MNTILRLLRLSSLAALWTLVLAPSAPGWQVEAGPPEGARHLILLHTNDLHGQVQPRPAFWLRQPNPPLAGGLQRIAGYVNRVRREAAAQGADVLVLDAGDWTQGTPEGALAEGRDFLRALQPVGYDAMCLGNHEFDHGVLVLEKNLRTTPLPVVTANVARADGSAIPDLPAYRIFERAGVRLAVVGLLSPETPRISHPSARTWTFSDPARALRAARAELAGRVDWVVPLTHLGLTGDRDLARAHPDLDLIVGGHSHSVLAEGVLEGSTRIVQAGSKASAVGRVDIWFDVREKRVVKLEARLVDLFREPSAQDRNREVQAACRAMLEGGSESLDAPLGTLAAPMLRAERPLESSSAGNLICDAMRAKTGADVAFQNRGGIRANLYTGVVTYRDVFELTPFSNHLVVLTLEGRELEACVRRAVEGPGRRGPEVSGMMLRVRRTGSAVELVAIAIGGRALDPDADYTVATNSFLAQGGDGYEGLERAERRAESEVLLRDVVAEVFAGGAPVTPPTDNRYVFVD